MRGVLDDPVGRFHALMVLCIIFHWFLIRLSEKVVLAGDPEIKSREQKDARIQPALPEWKGSARTSTDRAKNEAETSNSAQAPACFISIMLRVMAGCFLKK